MTVALDMGVHSWRSLRRVSGGLLARQLAARYVVVPERDPRRTLLPRARMQVPTGTSNEILVTGQEASQWSTLLQMPELQLFPRGSFASNDPTTRQLIAGFVAALLPKVNVTPRTPCALIIPENVLISEEDSEFGSSFLKHVVQFHGYEPTVISPTLAAVYAEMWHASCSALCLVMGAASTRIGLVIRGNELFHCSIPKAGDWLDDQVARAFEHLLTDRNGIRFPDLVGIRQRKENQQTTLQSPENDEQAMLRDLYSGLLSEIFTLAGSGVTDFGMSVDLPRSLPLLCVGGSTQIWGFSTLVQKSARDGRFPIAISDVVIGTDPVYAIPRGALVRMELEAIEFAERTAA